MNSQSRTLPLLSYLLPLAGPAAVLAARRDDPFARYHAAQGLAIDIGALAAPLLWAAAGWALAWLPMGGALLGLVLFALVLALELVLLVARALGVFWVLSGEMRAAPVVGGAAERVVLAEESEPAVTSPVSPAILEATAEQPPEGDYTPASPAMYEPAEQPPEARGPTTTA